MTFSIELQYIYTTRHYISNIYKGEMENAQKNNFDFFLKIGLSNFSWLVVPYLHAKFQKISWSG